MLRRQGYFYYIFGFCFIVGVLTVLITVEVSLVCTYVQLCAEDYLWWCATLASLCSPPARWCPWREREPVRCFSLA